MTVQSEISVRLKANEVGSNDFGGPSYSPAIDFLLQMQSGVGANQADILWMDVRTVADGANDDIDLAGVLQSAFGVPLTFVEIVAICVVNKPEDSDDPDNTTSLSIGGGAAPFIGFFGAADDVVKNIGPGGIFLLASPDGTGLGTVTPTTADILRITNSAGAAATYQIGVLGRTA